VPRAILRVCVCLVLAATGALDVQPLAALDDLLENGGFEDGLSGWSGAGLSTAVCAPRSGSAAAAVANAGTRGVLAQRIDAAVAVGTYKLRGWARSQTGAPRLEVNLIWVDASGSDLRRTAATVLPGPAYTSFSLTEASSPAAARGLEVRVVNTAAASTACLDDLSLEGPPEATATPPPSATPAPSATASPSPSPGPTSTPAPTEPPPTPAQQPSPAAFTAAFAFVNGGFEAGLLGWEKFGGELRLVTSPVHGGANAGALFSETASTKWAYQTVLVEPSKAYAFSGYVQNGAGAARSFLRISWYASGDGSGSALSTSDSTSTVEGAGGEFAYLTTGPVAAPAGARSARPRIVLTPAGPGPAAVFFDDLSFGEAAPATPTPAPTPRAAPSPAPATGRSQAPDEGAAAGEAATAVPAAEVAAARSTAAPAGEGRLLPLTGRVEDRDEGVPGLWLAGLALFVAGLAGAYFRSRRPGG